MPRAFVTLRQRPEYRWEAFVKGAQSRGYEVVSCEPRLVPSRVHPDDLVVVWNLSSRSMMAAEKARSSKARVMVAENGYLTPDQHGRIYYSVAMDGHNGSGRWRTGDAGRLHRLGAVVSPWQHNTDGHVLVCDQRGIGSPTMRSPYGFADNAAKQVRAGLAKRGMMNKVVVRPHPGRHAGQPKLEDALQGACAVVVWSSNVANLALARGIPAYTAAPHHVNAAVQPLERLYEFERPEGLLAAFSRLAWHQWHVKEIESGEPYRVLLGSDPDVVKIPWTGGAAT